MQTIRRICVILAGADTHTGVLDWFDVPILDLFDWYSTVEQIQEQEKKKGRG